MEEEIGAEAFIDKAVSKIEVDPVLWRQTFLKMINLLVYVIRSEGVNADIVKQIKLKDGHAVLIALSRPNTPKIKEYFEVFYRGKHVSYRAV